MTKHNQILNFLIVFLLTTVILVETQSTTVDAETTAESTTETTSNGVTTTEASNEGTTTETSAESSTSEGVTGTTITTETTVEGVTSEPEATTQNSEELTTEASTEQATTVTDEASEENSESTVTTSYEKRCTAGSVTSSIPFAANSGQESWLQRVCNLKTSDSCIDFGSDYYCMPMTVFDAILNSSLSCSYGLCAKAPVTTTTAVQTTTDQTTTTAISTTVASTDASESTSLSGRYGTNCSADSDCLTGYCDQSTSKCGCASCSVVFPHWNINIYNVLERNEAISYTYTEKCIRKLSKDGNSHLCKDNFNFSQ